MEQSVAWDFSRRHEPLKKWPSNGGWRFSDGYWNYYDKDDRAWYHTDGRNWYSYGNNAWSPYKFDNNFGKAYVREGYVAPKPGPDIVVRRHRIMVTVP